MNHISLSSHPTAPLSSHPRALFRLATGETSRRSWWWVPLAQRPHVWSHDIRPSVHPGEGSSSVALLKGSSLIFFPPVKGFFLLFLGSFFLRSKVRDVIGEAAIAMLPFHLCLARGCQRNSRLLSQVNHDLLQVELYIPIIYHGNTFFFFFCPPKNYSLGLRTHEPPSIMFVLNTSNKWTY